MRWAGLNEQRWGETPIPERARIIVAHKYNDWSSSLEIHRQEQESKAGK